MHPLLAVTLIATALLGARPAAAAEVKVLTTGAFKPVVSALVPEFERASGHKVVVANDTAGALVRRIEGGETFDLLVLTPAAVADMKGKGRLAQGTDADLARVAIGVAVKEGAPRPDIGSLDAFKRTLMEAPSVAYIDPAAGGSSGVYLSRLFERLGLADAIGRKAVLVPGGLVAERVVRGEAAIAIHQISEILAVPGATLVGPLPAEIQNWTTYTGAVSTAAQQPEAARALLAHFRSDTALRVLSDKGMEPPR